MKKVEITLFSIDELKQPALEKALQWVSETFDYSYNSDNKKTLKEFCRIFDVDMKDWSYDEYYINYYFDVNNVPYEYTLEDIKGLHLYRYIQNNLKYFITKGKFYSTPGHYDENGKYSYKHRYSKVILEGYESCPLTGYYIDHDILKPVFDYLKKPDMNKTYYDLIDECLNSFFKACQNDYIGHYEPDHLKELASINNVLFCENGKFYGYE